MIRIIGHLDMDAFFASVEERDNSRLAGSPLVIGSDPEEGRGRGVVSTANYKAREYGIRSALPISTAWRLSEAARAKGLPPATFLEVDMHRYSEASQRIMAIIRRHAEHVEEASVDEAYFDLSFADSYERAAEIAHAIKDEIRTRERLTASVGIGPNKLIAKIASDKNKPDGFLVVRDNEAETFLAPMAIRKIPGVGPKDGGGIKKNGCAHRRRCEKVFGAGALQHVRQMGERAVREIARAFECGDCRNVGSKINRRAGNICARHARREHYSGAADCACARRARALCKKRICVVRVGYYYRPLCGLHDENA